MFHYFSKILSIFLNFLLSTVGFLQYFVFCFVRDKLFFLEKMWVKNDLEISQTTSREGDEK